jgi:hypothetical protein
MPDARCRADHTSFAWNPCIFGYAYCPTLESMRQKDTPIIDKALKLRLQTWANHASPLQPLDFPDLAQCGANAAARRPRLFAMLGA